MARVRQPTTKGEPQLASSSALDAAAVEVMLLFGRVAPACVSHKGEVGSVVL